MAAAVGAMLAAAAHTALEVVFACSYLACVPLEWAGYLVGRGVRAVAGGSGGVRLEGKVAVVTGGGHGIGRAVAEQLAARGCHVVILELNPEFGRATVHLIGADKCEFIQCDVSDRQQVYRAASQVLATRDVHILVNNAGVLGDLRPFLQSEDSINRRVLDINVMGHFWSLKAFLPGMVARNSGCVVTVASVVANTALPHLVDYSVSKHAVKGLHEAVSAELYALGKTGVRTVLVMPGMVASNMYVEDPGAVKPTGVGMQSVDAVAAQIVDGVRHGKRLVFTDVASRVMYLLKVSSSPAFVTQQIQGFGLDSLHRVATPTRYAGVHY